MRSMNRKTNTASELDLFSAIVDGDLERARNLAQQGLIDILKVTDNRDVPWNVTPLMYAARNGHGPIVDWLLSVGAKVGGKDRGIEGVGGGQTAVHYAAMGGHGEIIERLVGSGADINSISDCCPGSALSICAQRGDVDLCRHLIQLGAGLEVIGKRDGRTAVFYAVDSKNEELIRLLVEAGAIVDRRDSVGVSVLFSAIVLSSYDVIKSLHAAGADFDSVDNFGCIALHDVVLAGRDEEIIKYVYRNTKNPRRKNKDGLTAYGFALDKNRREGAEILAALGLRQ